MFASWEVKQLTEDSDNEQNVVVAITSGEVVKHCQQCCDLAQRQGHYVCLLNSSDLLQFYGAIY